MSRYCLFFIVLFFASVVNLQVKGQNAKELVQKMTENTIGESNSAKMKMSIVREDWIREIEMQSWSKGQDLALILITSPARDKGSAFLKRNKEIWNWQPSIDRIIKLPPSMMMQSWMGSDFTNDDLVKQSSMVTDYEHTLVDELELDGLTCYLVELIPKPEAPVVWGKLKIWIEKTHLYQLKAEFYDEDGYLINVLKGSQVKNIQGRHIPTVLTVHPEEEDEKTIIEYKDLQFDIDVDEDFFSVQQMKRLRADAF